MIPETPSRTTIGKRIAGQADRELLVAAGIAERRDDQRRDDDQEGDDAARPRSRSQKRVEATRHARFRSPFSRSSLKTGTNADESAASATSERMRFGTWKATVNALILPPAPK